MLHADTPVVRLQDWEIERLIMERKKLTQDMLLKLAQLRHHGVGHLRQECEVMGEEGSTFYIVLRQNSSHARDFSAVLGYKLPDTGRIFRLRRYDSKAEHKNRIERQRFTDFHIHQATARYQARGFDEDGYAVPSEHFTDLHEALQRLFVDCGCDLPPDAQISLFSGGQP